MCHYRHHAHDDPFFLPGLQDITSHVDFSAIAQTALDSGLQLAGYTTQAHFLINCGITDLLARIPADQPKDYLPLVSQVQQLINPAEMGELFKVMALSKTSIAIELLMALCEEICGAYFDHLSTSRSTGSVHVEPIALPASRFCKQLAYRVQDAATHSG